MVQAVGLCRSHSHSLLACLTNFPPVDPVLGLWPNSGLGGSGDVPVFDIHRSTAASATLQATVKPCSLQVHQCSPCDISPVLKTPGMEGEKSVRLSSPCSLLHRPASCSTLLIHDMICTAQSQMALSMSSYNFLTIFLAWQSLPTGILFLMLSMHFPPFVCLPISVD